MEQFGRMVQLGGTFPEDGVVGKSHVQSPWSEMKIEVLWLWSAGGFHYKFLLILFASILRVFLEMIFSRERTSHCTSKVTISETAHTGENNQ